MTCDHINRNKLDNRLVNLRWATPREQALNKDKSENSKNSLQNKSVIQYDIQGAFVKIWPSRKEAAQSLNIDSRRISNACSTGQLFENYYWRDYSVNVSIEGEIWLPVTDPNFIGFYVSSYGRVLTRSGTVTTGANSNGYRMVKVKVGDRITTRKVHCLVMEAFVGPSDLIVNHKDGNKANNNLDNLEYVTHSENAIHARETGLHKGRFTPVIQYSLTGNPVAIYKSTRIAQRGNNGTSLTSVLSGITKTCRGYRWGYLESIYPKGSIEYDDIMQRFDEHGVILL